MQSWCCCRYKGQIVLQHSSRYEVVFNGTGVPSSLSFPRDIQGVIIQGPWANTWNGMRNLLAQSNRIGVAIFVSDENMRALSACSDIYVDGTFRTAPHPHTQIITIHGKYQGWVLPLVMAFSTGKQEAQYRCILRSVGLGMQHICNRNWQPQRVITDFEVALINALRLELPQTQRKGCYFHFTQSIMRRVSDLGLRPAYHNDPVVQQIVRRIMSLGYIPIAHVRIMFM